MKNDIADKTITRLRNLPAAPGLEDPWGFSSEVINRIRPVSTDGNVWRCFRGLSYAASIIIIALFVGLTWADGGKDGFIQEKTTVRGMAGRGGYEQKIESISSAAKLVERYKSSLK